MWFTAAELEKEEKGRTWNPEKLKGTFEVFRFH